MTERRYCKRLIEVDLPIKRISKNAREEKDSRCAHIPRLHIYPAARPLAACRAVICATIWPDPCDSLCPQIFSDCARDLMLEWTAHERQIKLGSESRLRFEAARKNPKLFDDAIELRKALLDFVADFSKWENATSKEYLDTSQKLTQVAHETLGSVANARPILVDPFAGGGAIPLEGLRVGADVYSSDSNPLAVLINKVVLQYAPKFGEQLSEEVLKWGREVNRLAEKELARFYPSDGKNIVPIAYLWARTVISESPDRQEIPVEVPLIRSMWLSKKTEKVALRWKRDERGKILTSTIDVTYVSGKRMKVRRPVLEIFKPKSPQEVEKGTVLRNSAICPITGYTTAASRVQFQLKERFGGALDARLFCVVNTLKGQSGRMYSIPTKEQLLAYQEALEEYQKNLTRTDAGRSLIPDETVPVMSEVFNAPLYGHSTWGSLFNARQALALLTYIRLAKKSIKEVRSSDREYAEAFAAVIGLAIDRLADLNASLCVWQLSTPNTAHVFGRWALPMIMDYGEVNPLAGAGGSPESAIWRIAASISDIVKAVKRTAEVSLCSADLHPLPHDSVDLLVTDPPYYNAVPYADISDFFYVWLSRTIGDIFPDLFVNKLSPKDVEICEMSGWDAERYPHKDKKYFELKMTDSLKRAREYLKPSGIGVVVFAHKTTAGWEAMLQALIDAGWMITASWPIDTEMASRLRAKNSAVLSSSIHLICRPRENEEGKVLVNVVGDWRDVLRELPIRMKEWMPRLAQESIIGADAIFACLGPALEIFSRYSRIEKASGEAVSLREYLEQVWAAVAKEALNMIFEGAHTEGFEEDARLTAMWLWTLSAAVINENQIIPASEEADSAEDSNEQVGTSSYSLEFDAARKIAQGLGVHIENLTTVVETEGDKARLLSVSERVKILFGKESVAVTSHKKKKKENQLTLFEQLGKVEEQGWSLNDEKSSVGKTVLDRLHQAMILFGAGRAEALRRFLVEEGIGKDERFWRLAQALSALYPPSTDEKRWVDGVLARKKSLGF